MKQLKEKKLTPSGQRSSMKLAYLKIYGLNLQIYINVNFNYLSNETTPGSIAITFFKL